MRKILTKVLFGRNLVVNACLLLSSLNQVSAEVILFQDTFTAANSNLNAYGLGGQSGSIVTPVNYSFGGASWQTQINNNSALIYANGNTASFSLNHNFTNGQQLRISSSFTLPQATAWIKFGSGKNADFNVVGGAAFTFNNSGAAYLYDGTVGTGLGNLLQINSNTVQIDINSSENYTGTGIVGIDILLNGTQLDLNGATAGTTYFTTSGFTQNFITFAQYSGGLSSWTVQDWQVASVPEPSTFTFLMTASLLAFAVNTRRRHQS